ncbi:MAG: hypothetical protein ACKVS8_01020 [Phycisphaerales bacterium]
MAAPVAEAVGGDGEWRACEVDGRGGIGGRDVRPTRPKGSPSGPNGAAFDVELVAVAGEGDAVFVGEVAEEEAACEAGLACGLVIVADDAIEPGERGVAEGEGGCGCVASGAFAGHA